MLQTLVIHRAKLLEVFAQFGQRFFPLFVHGVSSVNSEMAAICIAQITAMQMQTEFTDDYL
ncbi:hypothetical protein WJ93_07125 [Burkholderia ubonensis]|nr:hypothetical protein WJ93_07125 [Burkholderia ubonensis]